MQGPRQRRGARPSLHGTASELEGFCPQTAQTPRLFFPPPPSTRRDPAGPILHCSTRRPECGRRRALRQEAGRHPAPPGPPGAPRPHLEAGLTPRGPAAPGRLPKHQAVCNPVVPGELRAWQERGSGEGLDGRSAPLNTYTVTWVTRERGLGGRRLRCGHWAPTSGSCAEMDRSFFSSDGFLCLIITSLDAGPGGRSCGLGKLGGRGLPRGPPQLLPAAFKADIAEEAWCHWGPSPGTPGAQDAREGGPQRLALSQTPPPRPDAAQPWAPVHFPGQAAGDPGSLVLPPRLPPSSAVCSTSPEKEPGGKGAPFLGPAT